MLEDRKALLRDVIGAARCERVLYVDRVRGIGRELLDAVREVGAKCIVSKGCRSLYRRGESREWFKTKVFEVGTFMITGFAELGDRRLDTIYVAEERDGQLVPAGAVKLGLAGQRLWHILDQLRGGVARKNFVPVRPVLQAQVKFFGRGSRCCRSSSARSARLDPGRGATGG